MKSIGIMLDTVLDLVKTEAPGFNAPQQLRPDPQMSWSVGTILCASLELITKIRELESSLKMVLEK